MFNEYDVKYYLGNKKNIIYKLWICAHDENEAETNCILQAGIRHGRQYKVNIIDIIDRANPKENSINNEIVDEVVDNEPDIKSTFIRFMAVIAIAISSCIFLACILPTIIIILIGGILK